MRCPVCGENHISFAPELLANHDIFTACSDCSGVIRDKSVPPDDHPSPSCHCGRAFIDDVYTKLYHLLVDTGQFLGDEPLSSVGTPIIDPGIFLRSPPFLPPRSLLLISSAFDKETAQEAYRRIPQISGILNQSTNPAGIGDLNDNSVPVYSEQSLLCGCDVRADLFPTRQGSIAVYKKQGSTHIEFPHAINPKIRSVEGAIRKVRPSLFVDACCGAGTLGIVGGVLGVPHILLNDPWYTAAFFSAINLLVNKKALNIDECTFSTDFAHLSREKVHDESLLVAEGHGPDHTAQVFQGRMEYLPSHITDPSVLTVFDPFDKPRFMENQSFLSYWQGTVGREVFIP